MSHLKTALPTVGACLDVNWRELNDLKATTSLQRGQCLHFQKQ
ncbi:MAG: hypothetical protein U1F13_05870 [Acinetobacter parvus]